MPTVVWTLEQKRSIVRARRLVFEGARRLAAQQKRLKRLRAGGHYIADAERLLVILEDSQLAMYAHLARQESQSGP